MGFIRYSFSFLFLFAANSFPLFAGAGLETDRYDASLRFDLSAPEPFLPEPGKERPDERTYDFVVEMREVMSSGQWSGSIPVTRHFMFRHADEGWTAQAQAPGLEGFYWTKTELEKKYGADKFIHHLDDYFSYLDGLLAPVSWTGELRSALAELKNKPMDRFQKNEILNSILENYILGLRENMDKYDQAAWIKKARIYELFPRAYNLEGRRETPGGEYFKGKKFFADFESGDFDIIKNMGFDTVWPMGILPIGVKGQTGAGGGSPYSISDHGSVNPDLGTEEDFRNFVGLAHQAGLKVIVDFVVNHTSLDSKLLEENPDYFISYESKYGACPKNDWFEHYRNGRLYCVHNGGFEYGGGVSSWIDTAQINYSDPQLRKRMTETVKSWVVKFDVDGFRVDMAYLALNNVFSRTWNRTMPSEEFYRQLIGELKAAKPSAGFLAEAYAFQEDLSACGFDAIYSKYETGRVEGQTGWYNASESGDVHSVNSSINRNAFLAWQKGGAGSVMFVGNHDEAAPERVYGPRLPAALALTMLYPGGVMMYSGAEIGYDAHVPGGEPKPLPFSVPCQIDWNGGSPWVKAVYGKVLPEVNALRRELGDYEIEPLWLGGNISGYTMSSISNPGLKKAVLGNLSHAGGSFNFQGHGGYLAPGEYRIIDVP